MIFVFTSTDKSKPHTSTELGKLNFHRLRWFNLPGFYQGFSSLVIPVLTSQQRHSVFGFSQDKPVNIKNFDRIGKHTKLYSKPILFIIKNFKFNFKIILGPGWCGSVDSSLRTKGSPVQFSVRTHARVVGQDPSRGHVRGNHTLMFLSPSFSLPSPL